ncbi:MAG TPA: hypothetical protein VJR89_15715, partial [Polyangiales bacterium]|nr:hypothetical protein [Polyangiales bacterium]
VAQLPTLRVPVGESTATGRCTFTRPQTLVGYLPHMHLTGTHAKVVLHTGGQDIVVHDQPYVIDQQIWYDFPAVQVQAGDYFDYACTFQNTTGKVIYYGEEIEQEMCMIGVTRYPGGGDLNCLR